MDPENNPTPTPAPSPAPPVPISDLPSPISDPAPAPAPPPAAKVVVDGKTEREMALEKQLAERDALVKLRETEVAEARDHAAQLKRIVETPRKPRSVQWGFFTDKD